MNACQWLQLVLGIVTALLASGTVLGDLLGMEYAGKALEVLTIVSLVATVAVHQFCPSSHDGGGPTTPPTS